MADGRHLEKSIYLSIGAFLHCNFILFVRWCNLVLLSLHCISFRCIIFVHVCCMMFNKVSVSVSVNRKIAISQPRFERFRQHLARRRSSTLLSVPNVKNLKFPKSKMASASILKKRKSAISGTVRPTFAKFGTMTHIGPPNGTRS